MRVNVTLGLPVIRTSVDHGTALDLAGTGRADRRQPARGAAPRRRALHGAPAVNRAKKRFGQHFLHDPGTIDRIVRAIAPQPGDRLVEIGPGRGAITAPLLEAAGALDVVEIDRDLVPELERRCGAPRRRCACTWPTRSISTSAPCAATARRCASSATCPTTSPRRCCSTSSRSSMPCRTCTSCCRRKW